VIQYYKVQTIYSTGALDSEIIPITIPTKRRSDLFDSWFEEPVPGVEIEWQCAK